MQGHIEGEPLVHPSEQPRHEDEVGGAGNRQEFGETLQQGQQDGVGVIHRVGSKRMVG